MAISDFPAITRRKRCLYVTWLTSICLNGARVHKQDLAWLAGNLYEATLNLWNLRVCWAYSPLQPGSRAWMAICHYPAITRRKRCVYVTGLTSVCLKVARVHKQEPAGLLLLTYRERKQANDYSLIASGWKPICRLQSLAASRGPPNHLNWTEGSSDHWKRPVTNSPCMRKLILSRNKSYESSFNELWAKELSHVKNEDRFHLETERGIRVNQFQSGEKIRQIFVMAGITFTMKA